jgi:hypothetical protein
VILNSSAVHTDWNSTNVPERSGAPDYSCERALWAGLAKLKAKTQAVGVGGLPQAPTDRRSSHWVPLSFAGNFVPARQ